MTDGQRDSLRISFHGRIIDHLGIQMYQSPVAAVAELVANAWDADATQVDIILPAERNEEAVITIRDDGVGMRFDECESRYLNVGYCRRADDVQATSPGGRPILGRKGIGKFAGFGIAQVIEVSTVSSETGEKTVFELDLHQLRGEQYVASGGEIAVTEYLPPEEAREVDHGTTIMLRQLTMAKRPSVSVFRRSMSRRFLLLQFAEGFRVSVDGAPIPQSLDLAGVQYEFPSDYTDEETPDALAINDDGWGVETLSNEKEIRWKIHFLRDTIDDDELRGVSVFSKIKVVQRPFFFNLTGGLGGQHGQAYMAGQVKADYLDLLDDDVIATERQRVNWEHSEAVPLEAWGREKVKELLRIWHDRRGQDRRRRIEERVAGFADRLDKLRRSERRTVTTALNKVAGVAALSDDEFESLATAILRAWEQGRLRELIDEIATADSVSADSLLQLLVEADVLVALNIAEAVRTKLEAIRGLRRRIDRGDLENAVRDYIAEKPYLIHPRWETFKKETSVRHILDEAAEQAKLGEDDDNDNERKRIDLALRAGYHLLVVEFMKPGKMADWDHLNRCELYVQLIREKVSVESALEIERVTGLVVADNLDRRPEVRKKVTTLARDGIHTYTWRSLLEDATKTWREFLEIVGQRAPGDERLRDIQPRDDA